ncbi:helicase/relaxase domain-containing protein [Halomonas sp. KAO]|uniref:conjugal transfer nickase/helicase domain-containing protein n=1 Tax=Halomonas sp. KAO TaxID=2783858 RepID=UPI00189FD6BF|nr:DNA-binding domain-containing protein [Halomonas sp. KAO]MBF7052845.1 helicase/relaxase domain-containing protein [Halomonas sp. KAO]
MTHRVTHGIEDVPTKESRLYDEMQSHGLIIENAEGRSVWKCAIEMGEWKTELSMLKVHKSLVWSGDEQPDVFSGNVEPVEADKGSRVDGEEYPAPDKYEEPSPAEESDKLEGKNNAEPTRGNLEDSILDIAIGDAEKAVPNLERKLAPSPADGDESSLHDASSGQASYGEAFFSWLRDGLRTHKILMNDSKALVHAVDGMLLVVSPKVFKRYCQEVSGDEKEWKKVQDSFQKLKRHKKNKDGGSFHKVKVVGPNKKSSTLSGYLVSKDDLMEEGKEVLDNPFIDLIDGKNEE